MTATFTTHVSTMSVSRGGKDTKATWCVSGCAGLLMCPHVGIPTKEYEDFPYMGLSMLVNHTDSNLYRYTVWLVLVHGRPRAPSTTT